MTNKPPETYLAKLVVAWDAAPAGANTLRQEFIRQIKLADSLVASGSIASVGKNSANQSYKGYGPGGDTQEEIRGIWTTLLALYDQVQAKIKAEFIASADFDYTEPADFDYDTNVYSILTQTFTQQSAGSTYSLPDITDLRIPIDRLTSVIPSA